MADRKKLTQDPEASVEQRLAELKKVQGWYVPSDSARKP